MTDEELDKLIKTTKDWEPERIWKEVLTYPDHDWDPEKNFDYKKENFELVDEFWQILLNNIPETPPLEYLEALISNYIFSLLWVEDSGNKMVRGYENIYESLINYIITSIKLDVGAMGEYPDADIEPEDVQRELDKFTSSIVIPKFFK